MAESNAANGGAAKKGPNVAAMQAGRQAALAIRKAGPELTNKQKFLLSTVRQAKKACGLLAEHLQNGHDISPEAAEACNILSTEFVKSMI
jgi:hypothetical protein